MMQRKLAATMAGALLATLGCSNADSDPVAAAEPAAESAPGSATAEPRVAPPVRIPENELVSITDVDNCMKIVAGLLPGSNQEGSEKTREQVARFIAPEKFNGLDDVFAVKDAVASMEGDIQVFAAPAGAAKFMTFTVTPKSNRNGATMVNPYNPQGPGFVDMTAQLRQEAGMEFSKWGGAGDFACSFASTMDQDWKGWYVVQDEAQARTVESARVNGALRVRFDYLVQGLEHSDYKPTIQAKVAAVHLTDLEGKILASPTYYLPEYLR